MKFKVITVLALLMSVASGANALSCVPLKELIIAQCSNLICERAFYVKEVSGHLSCARRPVVEPTPSWAKDALEYELKKSELSDSGVYELELNRRYWNKDHQLNNIEDYIRLATDEKISMFFRPRIRAHEIGDIFSIREEWNEKEKSEYVANIIWVAIDWLSLLVFLALIAYSVKWFRSWLLKCSGKIWLATSICVQVLIFIAATLSMNSWSGFLVSFLFLLLPLIWLYEVVYLVYIKIRAKST